MNCAIVTPTLGGFGGEETVITKVCNSEFLKDKRVKISLIILGKSLNDNWLKKIKAKTYVSNSENEVYNFNVLRKLIKKEKIETVLCLSEKSIIFSYIIRKLPFYNHFTIFSWIHFDLSKVNTKFLKLADHHLAISNSISNQLQEFNIADEHQISVIFNPIDHSNLLIKKSRSNKFIYVGRITFKGQKNLKELIDGLAQCSLEEWSLSIIGDGKDVRQCQDYINSYYPHISSRIKWLGWIANPWEIINDATSLILTSEYEGLAMVLLESVANGLPCLASDCRGTSDIIKPGVNGELYHLGNLNDFNEKLQKIVMTNYNKAQMKKSLCTFYNEKYMERLYKAIRYEVI